MLKLSNLETFYGEVQVIWGVSLEVNEGEIVALVGSNGAGKTTILKSISRLLKNIKGQIYFNGLDISQCDSSQVVRLGISQVPEGRRLFAGMSVSDNLLMGLYSRDLPKKSIRRELEKVFELFPILYERRNQLAGTLSGGEQQMCAIGRGLMSNPKLLLIDEMSLGLAPVIVERLAKKIIDINKAGTTVLLVEQDVQTAFELASRGYVLETGKIEMQGDSQTLLQTQHIKTAYLGL